jgi:hypothetical protein
MNNSEKQEYLDNLLKELSENTLFFENENRQREIIEQLKLIYTPDFRHSYSDLFFQLQDIFSNSQPESKDTLTENLSCLRECFEVELSQEPENEDLKEVFRMFTKYYDHTNLEVGRYNFISDRFSFGEKKDETGIDPEQFEKVNKSIKKIRKDIDNQKPVITDMAKATEEMAKLDTKLAQNSVSSITTLTIFSAVILAFSGGITFQAGVFSGLGSNMTSSYRLVFIVALSGFVLFNTIFVLLYIISKLTKNNIATECKYSHRSNTDNECKKCGEYVCKKPFSSISSFCILWHRYSYILIVNGFLLSVLYFDFWLYLWNNFQNIWFLVIPSIVYVASLMILPVIRLYYNKTQHKRWLIKTENSLLKLFFELPKEEIPSIGFTMRTFIDSINKHVYGKSSENKRKKFIDFIDEKINQTRTSSDEEKRLQLKKAVLEFIHVQMDDSEKQFVHISTSENIINTNENYHLYNQVIQKFQQ